MLILFLPFLLGAGTTPQAEDQYRATVRVRVLCAGGKAVEGSGVIVGKRKVLTAAHVADVCGEEHATYWLKDAFGNSHKALLGRYALLTDAASLRTLSDLPDVAPRMRFEVPGRGARVCSVGGSGPTHLLRKCGEIIQPYGDIRTYADWVVYAYITSLCVVPGNSGGPVFYGSKLIGLVVAGRNPWNGECVGLFVPLSYVRGVL